MTRIVYDVTEIQAAIERVHQKIGDDRFSTMRLMELEKLIREMEKNNNLPGKTLLREVINRYRAKRWPAASPRRVTGWSRW
jgi:hypothetical protein